MTNTKYLSPSVGSASGSRRRNLQIDVLLAVVLLALSFTVLRERIHLACTSAPLSCFARLRLSPYGARSIDRNTERKRIRKTAHPTVRTALKSDDAISASRNRSPRLSGFIADVMEAFSRTYRELFQHNRSTNCWMEGRERKRKKEKES